MERRNWTYPELIAAFNLYCKIPFGTIHHRNSLIIELAQLLSRTPSAIAFKLSNFASFDPALKARGIKGLKNASKKDAIVFDKFYNDRDSLIIESEEALANFQNTTIEEKVTSQFPEIKSYTETEKRRIVKTRIGQDFFRSMVLANYDYKCAITQTNIPQLLVASHIISWSKNETSRLDPENGICLSATFDKAFDQHLLSFDENYRIIFSKNLKDHILKSEYNKWITDFEGKKIFEPLKYFPNQEFLEKHRHLTSE